MMNSNSFHQLEIRMQCLIKERTEVKMMTSLMILESTDIEYRILMRIFKVIWMRVKMAITWILVIKFIICRLILIKITVINYSFSRTMMRLNIKMNQILILTNLKKFKMTSKINRKNQILNLWYPWCQWINNQFLQKTIWSCINSSSYHKWVNK